MASRKALRNVGPTNMVSYILSLNLHPTPPKLPIPPLRAMCDMQLQTLVVHVLHQSACADGAGHSDSVRVLHVGWGIGVQVGASRCSSQKVSEVRFCDYFFMSASKHTLSLSDVVAHQCSDTRPITTIVVSSRDPKP